MLCALVVVTACIPAAAAVVALAEFSQKMPLLLPNLLFQCSTPKPIAAAGGGPP
jgi:hypothetical protein